MRRPILAIAWLATLLRFAAVAAAQRLAPGYLRAANPGRNILPADTETAPLDEGTLAFAGITGGVVGFVAGGYVALVFDDHRCREFGCLSVFYVGANAGASTLLPLAVHLANHRRGNLAQDLVVSLSVGAAGMAIADATDSGWPLLGIPIVQLAAIITMERHASPPNP